MAKIEHNKDSLLSMRIDASLAKIIAELATRENRSKNNMIRTLLWEALNARSNISREDT